MAKKKLQSKDLLLNLFNNIKELENRKYTYDNAISEVEQKIENAKVWEYQYLPEPPIMPEEHSKLYYIKTFLSFCFGLVIVWTIIAGIIMFICSMISKKVYDIAECIGLILLALVPVVSLLWTRSDAQQPMKEFENAFEEYQDNFDRVKKYNIEQKREADERVKMILAERTQDLTEWKHLSTKIEERLEQLYAIESIPDRYQNQIAMAFFVSYLESGRCDTLKECMNRYDDDIIYYQIKGKIEDIYRRVNEMEKRLTSEIQSFKSSFEYDLRSTEMLIDKNTSNIERISYDQKTNNLLTTVLLIENIN